MIVYLELSSWAGLSIGGDHWYGTLRTSEDPNGKRVEIEKEMTAAEARKQSIKDGFEYKKGDTTHRFWDKDNIRKIALSIYKKHWPDATALIEGSPVYSDPQFILDGFDNIKEECNTIFERAEEIGWYENFPKEMEELYTRWRRLTKPRRQ